MKFYDSIKKKISHRDEEGNEVSPFESLLKRTEEYRKTDTEEDNKPIEVFTGEGTGRSVKLRPPSKPEEKGHLAKEVDEMSKASIMESAPKEQPETEVPSEEDEKRKESIIGGFSGVTEPQQATELQKESEDSINNSGGFLFSSVSGKEAEKEENEAQEPPMSGPIESPPTPLIPPENAPSSKPQNRPEDTQVLNTLSELKKQNQEIIDILHKISEKLG